jgi:hypothetical protein
VTPTLPNIVRINAPNVVSEVFEAEVVVVNLESGCYFSLLGGAPQIWELLGEGSVSIDQLMTSLPQKFQANGFDLNEAIREFLQELLDQELIVASDAATADPTESDPATTIAMLERPTLEVFTDLQDILLLDPIHDVDEAGWPVATPPPNPIATF